MEGMTHPKSWWHSIDTSRETDLQKLSHFGSRIELKTSKDFCAVAQRTQRVLLQDLLNRHNPYLFVPAVVPTEPIVSIGVLQYGAFRNTNKMSITANKRETTERRTLWYGRVGDSLRVRIWNLNDEKRCLRFGKPICVVSFRLRMAIQYSWFYIPGSACVCLASACRNVTSPGQPPPQQTRKEKARVDKIHMVTMV